MVTSRAAYFSLSAALAIPALAQAASLSPPGAPLTATAPMVTSPTLIGTPPWALIVPGMVAGGAAVPAGGGVAGPDGLLYSIVAVAFILATSVVAAVAPSSRIIAFGALRPSTTNTVTLYPSARHLAIASCAMVSATSNVRTFAVGSCANPLVERASIAALRTTTF